MTAFAFGRGKCLDCGKFLIGALDSNGELRCARCTEKARTLPATGESSEEKESARTRSHAG